MREIADELHEIANQLEYIRDRASELERGGAFVDGLVSGLREGVLVAEGYARYFGEEEPSRGRAA